jgi:L,D-transpeptidase catalytic domain
MRRTLLVVWVVGACVATVPPCKAASMGLPCAKTPGQASVGGPTRVSAWRGEIEGDTPVYSHLPGRNARPTRWLSPANALWLMILRRPRLADGRCWLRVRLPWRPNDAAGWVSANDLVLERTPWRIEVSTARRTLTLFRAGIPVRTVSVVVGKSSTPTPAGLFAIVWAIPWQPNDFLGSWVLELTAHSNVLQHFEGADGTVGIHGRGGASLLDPLGSARSHGCVRLANDAIDGLVATVGEQELPGTPVQIG